MKDARARALPSCWLFRLPSNGRNESCSRSSQRRSRHRWKSATNSSPSAPHCCTRCARCSAIGASDSASITSLAGRGESSSVFGCVYSHSMARLLMRAAVVVVAVCLSSRMFLYLSLFAGTLARTHARTQLNVAAQCIVQCLSYRIRVYPDSATISFPD